MRTEFSRVIEDLAFEKYEEGTNLLNRDLNSCLNSLGLALGYYRYVEDCDGVRECLSVLREMRVSEADIRVLERRGYDNALKIVAKHDRMSRDYSWVRNMREIKEVLSGKRETYKRKDL